MLIFAIAARVHASPAPAEIRHCLRAAEFACFKIAVAIQQPYAYIDIVATRHIDAATMLRRADTPLRDDTLMIFACRCHCRLHAVRVILFFDAATSRYVTFASCRCLC